ncbi:MAG: serine--tRNA ligase [Candidatus Omnitrophica bacterium]|nr:serine--tRNA ligase [Candidatus Omnitrophota bacterium]
MLDLKFIRENTDAVAKSLNDRAMKVDLEKLLSLDSERRKLLIEAETLKHERNKASQEIGKMLREKKDANKLKADMKVTSQKIKELDPKVVEISANLDQMLLNIPNIPHSSVPIGPDQKSNKLIKKWGKIKKFSFKPRTHIELSEFLGIMDFSRASKITGTGFALYKGLGARLERALINFMLDLHTKKHNYIEVFPPFLVNRASMTGTGQLPKLEEDMYRLKDDDLFLIPTAEVPVTNMHRDETLDEEEMPLYYTAYTACFRREAGSYGKETRGLVRVHQFDKVELVKFVKPETSYDELEKLLKDAEKVIELLEIPYRVSALSTGDMSFAASKCYDIELWAPGTDTWLEVSSCSNFTDFQARRANIKYRSKGSKKTIFVHTLNGSGVALARLVVAILENHQEKDGSVVIPEPLRPYMDSLDVIKPS